MNLSLDNWQLAPLVRLSDVDHGASLITQGHDVA